MILKLLPLLIILPEINSCIYKTKNTPPENKINPGNWNDIQNGRIINDACECGEHDHNETGDPKWNVFIGHSRNTFGIQEIHPICVGTIITSNLIATVLRCVLTSDNVTLNVYNAWLPTTYSTGIMNKSDIIVSTIANGEGERFFVEEIIFGTVTLQHIVTRRLKNDTIHNDLLLLKVKVSGNEFMGKSHLRPICIPTTNILDFSNRLGIYYGVGAGQHPTNFGSDFHYGIIDSKRICDRELGKEINNDNSTEQFESLCLRWRSNEETPNWTFRGGSLFFQSIKDGTAFFAGVEYLMEFNQVWKADWNNYTVAYFTNILPMIKYIEHRANQHKSEWCRAPKILVLPDKITTPPVNCRKEIPFDGNEIPECAGNGSWWCAEHHDLMNNLTKTDWGRFAEGANILKEEIYKCNEIKEEKNTIFFYQKGNPEPFDKAIVSNSESARGGYDCVAFKPEWIPRTDYVYATTCVVILKECDSNVDYYWHTGGGGYPEGNKILRVRVNAGEKINLEWFGLARQVTGYRRCRTREYNVEPPPIVFFTTSGTRMDEYAIKNLCTCNNMNSRRDIPGQVINERECLELFANEGCTGWVRTIPAGRSIHSLNLNSNGPINYPRIKSFSRCSAKPNCYEKLDVEIFKIILKNKGVKNWTIQYNKIETIPKTTTSHDSAEGETTEYVIRNTSVLDGTFKIQSIKELTSRPNNGPYFELEDPDSQGVPHNSVDKIDTLLRKAYEKNVHKAEESVELVVDFKLRRYDTKRYIRATHYGFTSSIFHEWIYVADNVEFDYYALLLIHARTVSGESLNGDVLKEKAAKEFGFDTEKCVISYGHRCNIDAVFVRQDGKFSMSISDGELKNDNHECINDDKCTGCNRCCSCSYRE